MLDQYIQRYQNLEPFSIYSIDSEGAVTPWYSVDGSIIQDLVLNEQNVGLQVQVIGSQIMHWSRMSAQCKRVWEIEERNYRVWRSKMQLEILREPADGEEKPGWTKTAKGEPKPPTKERSEAMYRAHPEYVQHQSRIERAEEAYNAAYGVLDAFKAKRDMLKLVVRRNQETGSVELSI
jgi:hypothetical protein